jgi:hypothetical protein
MLGRNGSRRVRLKLRRETLRRLGADDLEGVNGGVMRETCTVRASGCSESVTQHPWNQICCN